MAPAWFTATELPHDPGSETGDDHEAASAGRAGRTANVIRPASAVNADFRAGCSAQSCRVIAVAAGR
jgi:hypothetical protein